MVYVNEWGGEGVEEEKHTISQLPNPNKPRHILIKHLKPTTILLRLARVTEAARAVEDLLEGFEINYAIPMLAHPHPPRTYAIEG